jgi:Tfp pilus assembly protein PilZ
VKKSLKNSIVLHIYDLNLLKFDFLIFIEKQEHMIKTRSNFKLCGEDIITKLNRLIAPYNFTVVFFQLSYDSQTTTVFLQLSS